ncbi:MAG TPA: GTPase domain-containing protein [Tepidisphaeraceae bacterium]|jgi:hypothetical protein|nr:GTPase domain-containing protein [Tepidisphaeraceae bacterium]
MNDQLEQLVAETIEITSAPAPDLLADDAPVFASADDQPMYLIGLIGGKDVGKSSFVNALVGQTITPPTSYGPGTENVVAYAHESMAKPLRELLSREVPDRFTIYTHSNQRLQRQVLLDLPDIDSHYTDHIEITRRMLRHMLYPVWIQSIEKYADLQPQKLLARVAAGNDPANFIFCLNKLDQLVKREGEGAGAQIRDDYSRRLARVLSLDDAPPVYLVSANSPDAFEFPQLRRALSQQRSTETVRESQDLAIRRQNRTLLHWLDDQQLPQRAERTERLLEDAQETVAARITSPLLEESLPMLMDDPAYRASLIEPVVQARIHRWPIVNIFNMVLSPLLSLVRKNLSPAPIPFGGGVAIETYLQIDAQPLSSRVQRTFAQLQQSQPEVGPLYQLNKLWDDAPADFAAIDLRQRISSTLEQQKAELLKRLSGRYGIIAPLFRWILTIGALLWFPIVQPILEAFLPSDVERSWPKLAFFIVQHLGVAFLLKSLTFLLIYYTILWLILRWQSENRVLRALDRARSADALAPNTPAGQIIEWSDALLDPIRERHRRYQSLISRIEQLRSELGMKRDAA